MAARFDTHTTLIATRSTERTGFAHASTEAGLTARRFGVRAHGVRHGGGDERALAERCAR